MLNNLSKSKIFMCETISTDFIVCPSVCPYVPYDRKLADGLSLLEVLISLIMRWKLVITMSVIGCVSPLHPPPGGWSVGRLVGWSVGLSVVVSVGQSLFSIIFILLSRSYSKPFLVPIWGENIKKKTIRHASFRPRERSRKKLVYSHRHESC